MSFVRVTSFLHLDGGHVLKSYMYLKMWSTNILICGKTKKYDFFWMIGYERVKSYFK